MKGRVEKRENKEWREGRVERRKIYKYMYPSAATLSLIAFLVV